MIALNLINIKNILSARFVSRKYVFKKFMIIHIINIIEIKTIMNIITIWIKYIWVKGCTYFIYNFEI